MVNISDILERLKKAAKDALLSLNFYRVHLLVFTFTPLMFSGIFYAVNGQFKIPYIDCLFLCFSCMCVTGLAPTDLSQLTTFQQFLLFAQTMMGSMIFVSLVMIYVRMCFFHQKFKHVIAQQERERPGFSLTKTLTMAPTALRQRFTRDHGREELGYGTSASTAKGSIHPSFKRPKGKGAINKDMIVRIDGGGVGLVNPMGWYDGTPMATPMPTPMTSVPGSPVRSYSPNHVEAMNSESHKLDTFISPSNKSSEPGTSDDSKRRSIDSDSAEELRSSPTLLSPFEAGPRLNRMVSEESVSGTGTALAPPTTEPTRRPYAGTAAGEDAFPRSKTIAFDDAEDGLAHEFGAGENGRATYSMPRTSTIPSNGIPWTTTIGSSAFPRTYSLRPQTSRLADARFRGFGGFPTPVQLISKGFHKLFPRAATKFQQTVTMPRTNTVSGRDSISSGDGQNVPYISFSAVVGRNSKFKGLTEDQMDELGGVEYRALKLLFWITLWYWILLPLAGATIIAPYIAAGGRYNHVFESQYKIVRIPWFAFFQAYSGFANLGMSLVDQSVIPFQTAYLMNAVVALLILFGNTCFPILLRVIIWSMWKVAPVNSPMHESLQFLLDHPRRCFIYLFPSTTTWLLAIIVVILTLIDFFSFMVLDIGTPAIDAIPIGTRIAAGLFQSVAVRAAGFAIVPMNSIAPAVKVMFVIMMYISVYPIAMSVRSTNVYEERSLGLFDDDEDDDDLDEEEEDLGKKRGANAVAKYLGFHVRRQLAFDMWWIVGALLLVCIIERPNLNDPAKWEYMNTFNIIFELVSAYGTVGLSLGVSYDNFSLVGGMRKLSKLVIIVVIIRGRHRGLPVAIDRAVMLPKEMEQTEEAVAGDRLRRMRSRMSFSEASVLPGLPRTFSQMTNATAPVQNTYDNDRDRDQMTMAGRSRGRTGSLGTSPFSGGQPLHRETSPSVMRRDLSQSTARFDPSAAAAAGASAGVGAASGPKHGHTRSYSSGASSLESVPHPAALSAALTKLQAEPTPPTASKLSNLPGLSTLVEDESSRRGTVAEPEQTSLTPPTGQTPQVQLGPKLKHARSN